MTEEEQFIQEAQAAIIGGRIEFAIIGGDQPAAQDRRGRDINTILDIVFFDGGTDGRDVVLGSTSSARAELEKLNDEVLRHIANRLHERRTEAMSA